MFDEDVLQLSNKLANLETHPILRRSLFIIVKVKGQVRLQYDEILEDNFIRAEISKYEIGWDNVMEGWVERSCRDIQEQHIAEK